MLIQSLKSKGVALALAACACLSLPSYAAVGGPGSGGTTFTTTTTNTTINHDTVRNVRIDTYERTILGYVQIHNHEDGTESSHSYNYHNTSDADLNTALQNTRTSIEADLSILGRGEVIWSDPVTIIADTTTHNLSTNTQVDSTQTTTTVTITNTLGPQSILIGDNQGTSFFVAAGNINIDAHTHNQFDVFRSITNTDNANTSGTYQLNGEKTISPIVLNMDGTGKLQASNGNHKPHPGQFYAARRCLFDFYGNGFPVAMEWVGPSDGLLCQPKADGKIDGTCLFGTASGYTDGFENMAALDANMDGRLTGAELNGLCVWQDSNGNARAEKGEVKSVKELDITQIGIQNKNMMSTFVMKGKTGTSFDWWPTTFEIRKIKNRA